MPGRANRVSIPTDLYRCIMRHNEVYQLAFGIGFREPSEFGENQILLRRDPHRELVYLNPYEAWQPRGPVRALVKPRRAWE